MLDTLEIFCLFGQARPGQARPGLALARKFEEKDCPLDGRNSQTPSTAIYSILQVG
jgi:hypothetical protein